MRAGGGLISAGDPLGRGRLAVAATQRARSHAARYRWRSTALDARQLLCVELVRDHVAPDKNLGHSERR